MTKPADFSVFDEIKDALRGIQSTLDVIAANTSPVKGQLGFIAVGAIHIYTNLNDGKDGWFTLDKDKRIVPCPSNALQGYITDIRKHYRKYNKPVGGKEGDYKFQVRVRTTDQTYIIEAGLGSAFARSFMLQAVNLTPEMLAKPITIISYMDGGDNGRGGLFATLYCEGNKVERLSVDGSWSQFNWAPIMDAAFGLFPKPESESSSSHNGHRSNGNGQVPTKTYEQKFRELAEQLNKIHSFAYDDVIYVHGQCGLGPINTLNPTQARELINESLIYWGSIAIGTHAVDTKKRYEQMTSGDKDRQAITKWVDFVKDFLEHQPVPQYEQEEVF